jgi:hypothetical protein
VVLLDVDALVVGFAGLLEIVGHVPFLSYAMPAAASDVPVAGSARNLLKPLVLYLR